MIKIIYVTITYQAAKVLQRTLDSVLEQDYPEIMHLIIDGASSDGTIDLVNDYIERSNAAENGHKVLLMSEPDKGRWRLCMFPQCRRLPPCFRYCLDY